MSYSELQNGSDIRGIALENETGEKVNLTNKAACDIAAAFTRILSEKTGKKNLKIAIGRDSRLTGEALLNASAKGIFTEGATAYDLGIASTPAMFMSTVLGDEPYDGSIMITASHLPWYRNGMKFFISRGGLEKSEIKEIAALAAGEVEGVEGIVEKAKNKSLIKADIVGTNVRISMIVSTRFGYPIPATCQAVQSRVKQSVENMTGLTVTDVNIRVSGVEI